MTQTVLVTVSSAEDVSRLQSMGFEVFQKLGTLSTVDWAPPSPEEIEQMIGGDSPIRVASRWGITCETLWRWVSAQGSPTRQEWSKISEMPSGRKIRVGEISPDMRLEIALKLDEGVPVRDLMSAYGLSRGAIRGCRI